MLGPSSEHLLLALVSDPGFDGPAILAGLGVDALTLVDAMPGDRRAPASSDKLKHWLLRVVTRDGSPQPGPVAPVFERYTAEVQRAVRAASEVAALLEHRYVQPFHLLLGCLPCPPVLPLRSSRTSSHRATWERSARRWSGHGCTALIHTSGHRDLDPRRTPDPRPTSAGLRLPPRRPLGRDLTPAAGHARHRGPRDPPNRRQRSHGRRAPSDDTLFWDAPSIPDHSVLGGRFSFVVR